MEKIISIYLVGIANNLQLAYANADNEAVLGVFALALVVIELAAKEIHRNVHQYHSFEQMVANRRHVLDTVANVESAVDDLCTTMKLICVDRPNKSKLVRDVMADSLVLDSFRPLVLVHFDVVVVAMDYSAFVRHVVVDFVGDVEIDVVPMKMVAIGLAYVTIHDDVYVMDYPI